MDRKSSAKCRDNQKLSYFIENKIEFKNRGSICFNTSNKGGSFESWKSDILDGVGIGLGDCSGGKSIDG